MKSKNQILSCVFIVLLLFCSSANAWPGDLDLSFGTNGTGIVGTPIRHSLGPIGTARAFASVVQPDDKIIAVGSVTYGQQNHDVALARYNADGTIDTSFGNAGQMAVRVNSSSIEEAFAVALQPDGKIVVGGYAVVTYSYSGTRRFFALWRFNSDGTKDYSFGGVGRVLTEFPHPGGYQYSRAVIRALVIQPDEKIVAVGSAVPSGWSSPGHALARYNSNGTLDSSFGSGGKINGVIGSAYNSSAYAAGLQSDGEIVTAGASYYDTTFQKQNFSAVRFNQSSGGVDSATTTHFYNAASDVAFALAVLPDDKIVLAGNTSSISPNYSDYALARYNADGTLDENFGYLGRVLLDAAGDDIARGVVVQADGKIVAAGNSFVNGKSYFSLVRFNEDGSVDFGFGLFGIVTTELSGNASFNSINLQSDGKIVAVGSIWNGGEGFALVRYEN